MKDKLNNALNEINDKYIEEAANADRLESSPVKYIKYVTGGAAAVAAVAALCIGLNHLGVFNRGVDLVDSLPSSSQGGASDEQPSAEGYQYAYAYYWEESMPLVSVTQDYAENLVFGSEFPYMLYASDEKAVFTDGLGGIYVYSFTEQAFTLAADVNKNVEFIKDNCPYEFFSIDPNNSSPAPVVNFKCGVDGEIICSITYYAEVPSTLGHTETEYRAYEQYYRINEEQMTLELFDSFALTDYALYGGLKSVTETAIEGAISHNVAVIDGEDRGVYLTLDSSAENMLYGIRVHKRSNLSADSDKNELSFAAFDGYVAKTIYLGSEYRSMMSTVTSTDKKPVLSLGGDGTFTLTHIFGDDTMVSGNYMVQGDVLRLVSYPLGSAMQPAGEEQQSAKATVWYLRFDESNALWAKENSFVSADGYALAGDKAVFIKQSSAVRYISAEQLIKDEWEYQYISAMLTLTDGGEFALALDSSGLGADLSGTYTSTDATVTLTAQNGKEYTFTKDGAALIPDEAFIKWLEANPDHPAAQAFLKNPVFYDMENAVEIESGTTSHTSDIQTATINGLTFNFYLELDLLEDGSALLAIVPAGENCPLQSNILIDEGTHRIENGRFTLCLEKQDISISLDTDHSSFYENLMNNVANGFDLSLDTPYAESVRNQLAENIGEVKTLELPETGNGRAALCDKILMANEPSAILESHSRYSIGVYYANSSVVGDSFVDSDNVDKAQNLFFADNESLLDISARVEFTDNADGSAQRRDYYVVGSTIGDYQTDGSRKKEYWVNPDTRLIERIEVFDCNNEVFTPVCTYQIAYFTAESDILNDMAEALENETAQLEEKMSEIEDMVQAIENEIAMFSADKAALAAKSDSSKYDEKIAVIESRVSQLENNKKSLESEISAIKRQLEENESKISQLENEANALSDNAVTEYPIAPVTVENIETGEKANFTDTKDISLISNLLSNNSWNTEGTTDCYSNIALTINGAAYSYHSDCGTFNDNTAQRSLSLDDAAKEQVNAVFAKYIPLTYQNSSETTQLESQIHAELDRELINEFVAKIAKNYKSELPAANNLTYPTGWIFPTENRYITTYYGYDSWRGGVHNGIDIAEEGGKAIRAAADGTAYVGSSDSKWYGGYGNTVAVLHDDGYITVYSCAYEILVSDGERVTAGQTIATVGTTGYSTGNHLHFEVRAGTEPIDPMNIIYDITDDIDSIIASQLNGAAATLPQSLSLPLPAQYTEISEGMGDNGYIGHAGLDFPVPRGTDVYAADKGEVVYADWLSAYGNCVILKHDNGCFTVYGHLNDITVSHGDTLSAGGSLGHSGSTGRSTGYHLHFELRRGASPVDPISLLNL